MAEVNGQPTVSIRAGGRVSSILTIEVVAEHIQTVYVIANPEKLARV